MGILLAQVVLRNSDMIRVRLKTSITWVAIFSALSWNLLPSLARSQDLGNSYNTSIVIWPRQDGTSDDATNDTAAALRHALPTLMPVHIVSPEIVEQVLAYHQKEESAEGKDSALENLARAKEHYFQFQYDEAMAEAARSIEMLSSGKLSENGTLLHDALLTQGLIAKAAEDLNLARESFDHAVRLNPFYLMDRKAFAPSIVELYEKSRSGLMHGEKGALRVETDPAAAEVFINGIVQGVTPLELPQVPAGSYSILIKTNKYQPVEKKIDIKGGEKVVVKEKLKWTNDHTAGGRKQAQVESARAEIDEGLRIADLLKVDKAVVLNCDETSKGGGILKARMFDRQYRAAHRQIVVEYNSAIEKPQAVADMTEALASMARVNLLNNPMKYLDPDGLGDPILLTGRKREFYKKPIFWGAVGTAAAGAIIGGILAAMSGGSSPDRGSVAVEFK